jgi:hypothetical protein
LQAQAAMKNSTGEYLEYEQRAAQLENDWNMSNEELNKTLLVI